MFKRIFTIGYDYYSQSTKKYGRRNIPCIRFSGFWLSKKAGLNIGDKILVMAEAGKIGILKIEKKGGQREDTTNANTATTRRARAAD